MIHLDHATKLYGQVIGVNDMTASLAWGGYGLLGPNGSGKSTLLNLITGQLRPTLGSVRVLDSNPASQPQVLRRIGYCPEQDMLYSNVTSLEWVRYMVRLHGFSARQASQQAEQALEQVGMAQAMRRPMGGYSRGMRQRTKLAQAIAHGPDLLILDEPLNGLDPVGRHEITVLLQQWIRAGKGLILASHILHEVSAVTQAFLLICNGRLLASGSTEEVQTLLADIPDEIRIRCDRGPVLARRLVEEDVVESVRLGADGTLAVGTRSPAKVYAGLPGWIEETGVQVSELRSSEDSLQLLFASLLRIHRGKA
jgi:ABC-2 type transport system ATP-binding protein